MHAYLIVNVFGANSVEIGRYRNKLAMLVCLCVCEFQLL